MSADQQVVHGNVGSRLQHIGVLIDVENKSKLSRLISIRPVDDDDQKVGDANDSVAIQIGQ